MANRNVVVGIIGENKLSKPLADAANDAEGFGNKLSGVGKTAAGVFTGVLASGGIQQIGGYLMDASKAAREDEAAQVALAQTLKTNAGATDAQIDSLEAFISKTQNATGVLDDELRPALGNLVRGSGDLAKSQAALSLAMDVSKGTGKDLGAVSEALGKALAGNLAPLKKLDPALGALIKEGASADEVMAALGETFGGQTAAAANTMEGKMARLHARMADFQENVGAKVNTVILTFVSILQDKVIPVVSSIINWMQEHKDVVVAVGIAIGAVLIPAFVGWAVAAGSAALATIAAAAPVIALTAVIAALVYGVIYAYEHWGVFRAAVDAVGDALGWLWNSVFKPVADWLGGHWLDVITIAGRVMVGVLTGGMSEVGKFIYDHWDEIIGFISDLPGKISNAASGMWDGLKDAFKAAINWIIGGWNSFTSKIGIPEFDTHIPGVGKVGGWSLGDRAHITPLATGGIVTAPTLALIGEAGPEAVVPLKKMNQFGNGGVTVIVQGDVYDADKFARKVKDAVAANARKGI